MGFEEYVIDSGIFTYSSYDVDHRMIMTYQINPRLAEDETAKFDTANQSSSLVRKYVMCNERDDSSRVGLHIGYRSDDNNVNRHITLLYDTSTCYPNITWNPNLFRSSAP